MADAVIEQRAARTVFVDEDDVAREETGGPLTEHPEQRPMYPSDEQFGDDDYREADGLQAVVKELIARCEEFAFLRPPRHSVSVRVLYKRKGGRSRGKEVVGHCDKLSGLAQYFSGHDFVIWVAADHARDMRLTNGQLEALLYHELCHIGFTVDDKTGEMSYIAKGHDDEFFWVEARRYGAWNWQRARSLEVWQQVPMSS